MRRRRHPYPPVAGPPRHDLSLLQASRRYLHPAGARPTRHVTATRATGCYAGDSGIAPSLYVPHGGHMSLCARLSRTQGPAPVRNFLRRLREVGRKTSTSPPQSSSHCRHRRELRWPSQAGNRSIALNRVQLRPPQMAPAPDRAKTLLLNRRTWLHHDCRCFLRALV